MNISLIVAAGLNNGIGYKNEIPWHLPADLQYFKSITQAHAVIMGRKTFQSIGKALPKRHNYVLSKNADFSSTGIQICPSLQQALDLCTVDKEIFIIGGADIYRQAWSLASTIYLTRVAVRPKSDRFFPEISANEWAKISEEKHHPDAKNEYPYTFLTYLRRTIAHATVLELP